MKKPCGGDIVVKSNRLIQAISNLSLVEVRLIQLAVVDARETGQGITSDSPLIIRADRYAEAFGVTNKAAYMALQESAKTLFERQVTLYAIDETTKKEKRITSRWVSQIAYVDAAAKLEIILSPAVVKEVTRLESHFTKYHLEQTAQLSSTYAARLYELLIQWKDVIKIPMFELHHFRQQLGLNDSELFRMSDFKKRVLDLAVSQINEHTDILIGYEQVKSGRVITGFIFTLQQKPTPKDVTPKSKKKPAKKENPSDIEALLKDDDWVSKHAHVGESWEQARTRLNREAETRQLTLLHTK
jgi:plasmid replication initiation protein